MAAQPSSFKWWCYWEPICVHTTDRGDVGRGLQQSKSSRPRLVYELEYIAQPQITSITPWKNTDRCYCTRQHETWDNMRQDETTREMQLWIIWSWWESLILMQTFLLSRHRIWIASSSKQTATPRFSAFTPQLANPLKDKVLFPLAFLLANSDPNLVLVRLNPRPLPLFTSVTAVTCHCSHSPVTCHDSLQSLTGQPQSGIVSPVPSQSFRWWRWFVHFALIAHYYGSTYSHTLHAYLVDVHWDHQGQGRHDSRLSLKYCCTE